MKMSPAYIELRRIEAAKEIATLLAHSRNKVYLDSDSLLLNLTSKLDANLEKPMIPAGYSPQTKIWTMLEQFTFYFTHL